MFDRFCLTTGVTFSFIWVSLTAYTAVAVPTVSLATIQGIMHGVFFGLGNGLGHLIGGVSIEAFGAVATFYSLSVVWGIWLVAFYICQKVSSLPSRNIPTTKNLKIFYLPLQSVLITRYLCYVPCTGVPAKKISNTSKVFSLNITVQSYFRCDAVSHSSPITN